MSLLLFRDETQSRFKRWITDLDVKVSENCSDYSQFTVFETELAEMLVECRYECFLRLAQATITELGQNGRAADQADVLASWLAFYYYQLKKIAPDVNRMVELLHLHFDLVIPGDPADVRVRNICMLLSIVCQIMYTKKEELEALFTDELAMFLVKVILDNSKHSLLYSLMCFGPFSVVDKLRHHMSRQEQLKLVLERLASNNVKFNLESVYNRDQEYVLSFRIGECAQWLVDYLFGAGTSLPIEECGNKLLTSKKFVHCLHRITRDDYTAFGFDHFYQNYQFSEGIERFTGNVFYYEAILLTPGSFHVGWALKLNFDGCAFKDLKEELISFNPYEKRIQIDGEEEYYPKLPPIKPCDVVGCLLDMSARTFKFYLNGYDVPHQWTASWYKLNTAKLDLSLFPYYPTACLSAYQQVYFNFGQAPFRFAPSGVKIHDIFEKPKILRLVVDLKKVVKVENPFIDLASSALVSGDRGLPALAEAPAANEQEKFNEWMRALELSVQINDATEGGKRMREEVEKLRVSLLELVKSEEDWIKLARAMITEMAVDDRIDVVNVMAMWMMAYIKLLKPPAPDKVIQLVQPNLESYLPMKEASQITNQVSIQLRNIYILLSILPQVYQSEDERKAFIVPNVVDVLVKLVANKHKSSKLYALYCFESFAKTCSQLKSLLKSQFKRQDFSTSSASTLGLISDFTNPCEYEQVQIDSLLSWFNGCGLGSDGEVSEGTEDVDCVSSSQSSNVSRDNLPHSQLYYYDWIDYNYQTEKNFYPAAEDSVCFFEAILMTSGSARIGWALSSEDSKDNAQCSPIFFDAYKKGIFFDGKPHPIETPLMSSKPGTVIGCLLNITSGTFSFFLDGELVLLPEVKLRLSAHNTCRSYFPTVCLAPYQQVYLNFGQTPFKYPPMEIQRQMSKKNRTLFGFDLNHVLFVCGLSCSFYFLAKFISVYFY